MLEEDSSCSKRSKWDRANELCPDDLDALVNMISASLGRSLDRMEEELSES